MSQRTGQEQLAQGNDRFSLSFLFSVAAGSFWRPTTRGSVVRRRQLAELLSAAKFVRCICRRHTLAASAKPLAWWREREPSPASGLPSDDSARLLQKRSPFPTKTLGISRSECSLFTLPPIQGDGTTRLFPFPHLLQRQNVTATDAFRPHFVSYLLSAPPAVRVCILAY
jgi:hypothetical protein